jgi:ribulose-phosphate 3-epimerase
MNCSRNVLISPSLLSADFTRLAEEVAAVEEGGADWLHVDVMDGHFVPNITIGPMIVDALKKVASRPLDVHLMISNPERYIEAFAQAGADVLTVHPEVDPHLHRTVNRIRELGVKAGAALNPSTGLHAVEHVLPDLDVVMIMTVNPGFGGQTFIPTMLPKIRDLRGRLDHLGETTLIEVDGGVNARNAGSLAAAGANVLVAGSAVFGNPPYKDAVKAIREGALCVV